MEELGQMCLDYENNLLTIDKLKYMHENDVFEYMAGSLFVQIRPPVQKPPPGIEKSAYNYRILDVRPIDQLNDPLDIEVQYWTSKIYNKHKAEGYRFSNQAKNKH